ncbi:Rad9-domain-containing protein [Xylariaceae sp. FL0804]|nr:Rad9-domain-containing protein [Xylariaceae sp. FL0804]
MPVVRFTLSEDGVSALRDVLSCLGKFSEEVSVEAKRDRVVFSAINLSKSAYASFTFTSNRFFSHYQYDGAGQHRDKFFCRLYNRALLPLFRSRAGDPFHDREKDTTIERCDIAIIDDAGIKSRFVAKIVFRNGITTKYRLPFEVTPPVRAKFDHDQATNNWAISSRTLRQLMDHFGPGIDYLDIHSEDDEDVVNFTCSTEKAVKEDEVLKKPLHTSIAVEQEEFNNFTVQDGNIHIVVSVKDFRAVVQHAAGMGSNISANYSTPAKPMQLNYEADGISCEFLLMTIGERGPPGQKAKKRANAKASTGPQLEASESRARSHGPTPVPQQAAPSQPRRHDPMPSLRPPITRPSQRPPPATLESESLFVPQENDDQWEPVNVNEDEEEEEHDRLGWDASGHPIPSGMRLRSMMGDQPSVQPRIHEGGNAEDSPIEFEPTQRLSQVRRYGLFGD